MSSLQGRTLRFIDEQLSAIRKRPGMWGPNIAVELQILQLLEFRSVVLRPELEAENPRAVLDAYEEFLVKKFPGAPPMPLASLLAKTNTDNELTMVLGEFCDGLVAGMHPEDMFNTHDLVLKLWLRSDVAVPRASTLSSYYDVFRRVLRAVSRPTGSRGRATQDIERAIDFGMSEVLVSAANGAPAHIAIPLDQLETQGATNVEQGVMQLVLVNEWAAERGRPVGELARRLQGKETAQRVAAQALRLMPSVEEAIQTVEMGGKLVGREHPIKIEPAYAERMVEVVKQSSELVKFDEVGSVRAVDIDRRSMRMQLGRMVAGVKSVQCWMQAASPIEVATAALSSREHVHVVGELYKQAGSPAMVIVRQIGRA